MYIPTQYCLQCWMVTLEYFDFRRHRFARACCLWRWGGWQVLARYFTKFVCSATNDFFERIRKKLFDRTGRTFTIFSAVRSEKGSWPFG